MRDIKFRAFDNHVNTMFKNVGFDNTSKSNSEITYMQYTGLKDKNGMEIYEGDLVHFTGKAKRDKIRTYEVIWENERSRFIGKHIAYEDQFMPIRLFAENHEVIGNIYENPELLK